VWIAGIHSPQQSKLERFCSYQSKLTSLRFGRRLMRGRCRVATPLVFIAHYLGVSPYALDRNTELVWLEPKPMGSSCSQIYLAESSADREPVLSG
jgi:hypothetical protein